MGGFEAFFIAAISGVFLAALTWFFARRSGLQPAQAALIDTLQENAAALQVQVARLKDDLAHEKSRREALEGKVDRLEGLVVELTDENSALRSKLGMPARKRSDPYA